MKHFILSALLFLPIFSPAQEIMEGSTYYLPKTELRVTLLVEKASTTPGSLNRYAERFLKLKDVPKQADTNYRILSVKLHTAGVPDSAKQYTARIDGKHSIHSVKMNSEGVILAVNTDAQPQTAETPFVPAPKQQPLNPHDYMNQDILAAGSTAKMAELTAQEIIDIRDSKSQLYKGQADFMPKDGEQLRIMLDNLNRQEAALMQLFAGVTDRDTTEITLTYVPKGEVERYVFFRFSKKLGLVERDDLAGAPYYLSVRDLHSIPTNAAIAEEGKRDKDDANIFVNMPGKIRVTLSGGGKEKTLETYAAQFGQTASLDTELFGKKLFTTLVYNPITGNIESIKTDIVKK